LIFKKNQIIFKEILKSSHPKNPSSDKMLDNALIFAKKLIASHVSPGDTTIDATVGNGHDTLLLAELVGETGKVYGFDIQEQAVLKTREVLLKSGFEKRAEIIHAGHERMGEFLKGDVEAVMFNLGYLPHGDKSIITEPETTVKAIEAAIHLLKPGGIITITCYLGHAEGSIEAEAVRQFAQKLPNREFAVIEYRAINKNFPPFLIAIEKYV
jgi:predicted methyltransferase